MNYNSKIAAGIVLYNPDSMERLEKCIHSVKQQVERIYIFDNSTDGRNNKSIISQLGGVYLSENGNVGIATALNEIIRCAKRDGYEWVITMDQDSILPSKLVESYSEAMRDTKIGMICPQVIDKRRSYMQPVTYPEKEYVEFCITSASCTSIKIWEKLGGFDEWLFVDLVDNEYCKRLIESGYKILRLNAYVLDQEFGKIIPKSEREQRFWVKLSSILHNKNIAKLSYKKYVSAIRVYFTCRNIIYVNRKLSRYGKTAYKDNYNCNSYCGFLISFVLPSILRADKKGEVIKASIKGTFDGLTRSVKPWNAPISER